MNINTLYNRAATLFSYVLIAGLCVYVVGPGFLNKMEKRLAQVPPPPDCLKYYEPVQCGPIETVKQQKRCILKLSAENRYLKRCYKFKQDYIKKLSENRPNIILDVPTLNPYIRNIRR